MGQNVKMFLVVAMVSFSIASEEATASLVPIEFNITEIGGVSVPPPPGLSIIATAAGTSNNVGWTTTSTRISGSDTNVEQTSDVFSGLGLIQKGGGSGETPYDVFHAGRGGFTITFNQLISKVLFYIAENTLTDPNIAQGLDFGITPSMTTGSITDIFPIEAPPSSPTRFGTTSTTGGTVELVLNTPTNVLTHSAMVLENFPFLLENDLSIAWFVQPVPEPSTLWLSGLGLAGIYGYIRRRKPIQMNGRNN